jgi:hypothetical protein
LRSDLVLKEESCEFSAFLVALAISLTGFAGTAAAHPDGANLGVSCQHVSVAGLAHSAAHHGRCHFHGAGHDGDWPRGQPDPGGEPDPGPDVPPPDPGGDG